MRTKQLSTHTARINICQVPLAHVSAGGTHHISSSSTGFSLEHALTIACPVFLSRIAPSSSRILSVPPPSSSCKEYGRESEASKRTRSFRPFLKLVPSASRGIDVKIDAWDQAPDLKRGESVEIITVCPIRLWSWCARHT